MTDKEQLDYVLKECYWDPLRKEVHIPGSDEYLKKIAEVSDVNLVKAFRMIRVRDGGQVN